MRRFTVNCLFCGAKNHKRSPEQRTFKCTGCGEVNFGPGMRRALVKAIELTTPAGRTPKADALPAAAVVTGQTTVIKAAKTVAAAPAKAATKSKAKAPAAPPKEPVTAGKRSWNPFYG